MSDTRWLQEFWPSKHSLLFFKMTENIFFFLITDATPISLV
jgi:hypothetical protein